MSLRGGEYARFHNWLRKKIRDPQVLQRWNKIFVISCIIGVSLDPLFFYIPVIDGTRLCLSLDKTMEIIACALRSFIDIFYIFHIVLQFRTQSYTSFPWDFRRGKLVKDAKAIVTGSYFIIDILSILPLPQLVILLLNVVSISHITKEALKWVIFIQYIPRIWRIYPLYKQATATSGTFTKTAWAGAVFNLFLYMLASHILGAFWYLFAVERRESCWRDACDNKKGCSVKILYCANRGNNNNTLLMGSTCPLLEHDKLNSTDFDFGIALDALQSGVAENGNFIKKLFFCCWWGLRNLSSLGQNLRTSTYEGEVLFAIGVSVTGLVLFSLLIGNMQKYLQSLSNIRVEEMRVKQNDTEQWMSHRMIPQDLRARVKRYEKFKWQENRGIDEESLIRNLPNDLRKDIKRHLCSALVKRVPVFNKLDEHLLDVLFSRLKPVLYTKRSYIIREGDPVEEMLFILKGDILTVTSDGGTSNEVHLEEGDFSGEEILTWALDPNSSSSLPTSKRTLIAEKDVEAFCLMSNDLKSMASQLRSLHGNETQIDFSTRISGGRGSVNYTSRVETILEEERRE